MQAVIFGWKRDHYEKDLEDCVTIAKELTKNNFDIYTGGGGGFMLAGNKGCYEVDPNKSYAVSVKCLYNNEGQCNPYYNEKNLIVADTFAERKDLLFRNMDLYLFFPGGMGTMDEFSELITLFKTGELPVKPIVLYNFKYWSTLKSWFEFNKLNWPESYITCIINSVDDFNKFYKSEFKSTELVKINESVNDDIENYKPISNKSNMFNDSLIDNLINEIFNDPIFKKDINNLLNDDDSGENSEDEEFDLESDELEDNEFVEIIILDNNEEIISDNYSIESSENENYDEIDLSDYESNSDSEDN